MATLYWRPVAGWMGFPFLSQSDGIEYSYTIGYRLKEGGGQPWTGRFNRFKNNDRAAIWGGARLLYAAVPSLIKEIGIDKSGCVFLAALSSREITADTQRVIPYIVSECARIVGVRSKVDALRKQAHGRIHEMRSADARCAELDKADYKCGVLDAKTVFVFDDFITRGDTLSHVANAVLTANPKAKVYGVALAKTEKAAFCPNPDNDHIPPAWDKIWRLGEQEAAAAKNG